MPQGIHHCMRMIGQAGCEVSRVNDSFPRLVSSGGVFGKFFCKTLLHELETKAT